MSASLIGRVSRDLHRSATYVRVNVPGYDGVPLALKATRGIFDRGLFKKGVVVEVTRTDKNDARRYAVTRVFKEEPGDIDEPDFDECDCNPVEVRALTKQVRFFLGSRYFNDYQTRDRMIRVLSSSFGISHSEANHICRGLGTWVQCREEQFCRFMINRDAAAIPNGFQDLRVEYVDAKPQHVVNVADRDLGR